MKCEHNHTNINTFVKLDKLLGVKQKKKYILKQFLIKLGDTVMKLDVTIFDFTVSTPIRGLIIISVFPKKFPSPEMYRYVL